MQNFRHYVQYDQGEDRWLCTLLLQQGWRVEYSAASDSFTACPEGFKEFYNQRRRWMPSTIANIMDLLSDYKRVIKNNDDISIFYIVYQIMMMVGTVLGPGSIYLMLAGALSITFGWSNDVAFLVNLIPLVGFVLICLYAKPDTQIVAAQVLSVVYGLVMMAVLVGMLIQTVEDGWLSPSTLSLIFVTFCFVFAAILHPQEFGCLPMGVIYYITIPSMYLFLVIYSVFNLNVVSWGTREVVQKKTAEEMEADKKKAEEAAKAPPKQKTGFLAWLTGADNKLAVWRMFGDKGSIHLQLKDINKKLDDIEGALKKEGYMPNEPAHEEERAPSGAEEARLVRGRPTVRIMLPPERAKRDDMVNPKWIEHEDLGNGPKLKLPRNEVEFWYALIEKYLKPLDKNEEKEKQVAAGLIELKNQMVFSFLMINSIWVITIYLLQDNKDLLYITWPIGYTGPKITYSQENEDFMQIEKEYLKLEPIGLLFVFFFAIVLFIQLVGMITHRIMTLGHIVSSTSISTSLLKCCGKKDEKAFDGDAIIDEHAAAMVRRWQKLAYDEAAAEDYRDQGEPIRFVDVVDRTLNTIVQGDADTMRRLSSGTHLKGTSSATNALLSRKETLHALKNRHTAVKRRESQRQVGIVCSNQ